MINLTRSSIDTAALRNNRFPHTQSGRVSHAYLFEPSELCQRRCSPQRLDRHRRGCATEGPPREALRDARLRRDSDTRTRKERLLLASRHDASLRRLRSRGTSSPNFLDFLSERPCGLAGFPSVLTRALQGRHGGYARCS